eukprot:CAMPEP_0174955314 /NCGR_PEP_ID=MMETSP0004_2-20121128/914_1 /TAXON_ID=420556 /ORGANISM="Ochromonas sp., Strain CCMP1393" /LENGTH=120 /DNA_ID=CAMNT_0016203231 /DNA_START=338 /DNA_END=700 /DNA_ORIENTATION=-
MAPHLFVIKKGYRQSKSSVETKEVFYCLDGILYQAPVFGDVLKTRIAKVSLHLAMSYSAVQQCLIQDSTIDVSKLTPTNGHQINTKNGQLAQQNQLGSALVPVAVPMAHKSILNELSMML